MVNEVSSIAGNASDDIKSMISFMYHTTTKMPGFATTVDSKLVFQEVSVKPNVEEPKKMDGRLVCSIVADQDLLNFSDNVHGACFALLIDGCSALAIMIASMAATGTPVLGISQSLNIVFHSPARKGDQLRMVSTSLSGGKRVHTARTEVWNVTRQRLVASGIHTKMEISPSKPRL